MDRYAIAVSWVYPVQLGRFTATVFIAFLDHLTRQARRKVHVIANRALFTIPQQSASGWPTTPTGWSCT